MTKIMHYYQIAKFIADFNRVLIKTHRRQLWLDTDNALIEVFFIDAHYHPQPTGLTFSFIGKTYRRLLHEILCALYPPSDREEI